MILKKVWIPVFAICLMSCAGMFSARALHAEQPAQVLTRDSRCLAEKRSIEVAKALLGDWEAVSISLNGGPFRPIKPGWATLKLPDQTTYRLRLSTHKLKEGASIFPAGGVATKWYVDSTAEPAVLYIYTGADDGSVSPAAVFKLNGDDLTWRILDTDNDARPFQLKSTKGDPAVCFRRVKKSSGPSNGRTQSQPGSGKGSGSHDKNDSSDDEPKRESRAARRLTGMTTGNGERTAPASPKDKSAAVADSLVGSWVGVSFTRGEHAPRALAANEATLRLVGRSSYKLVVSSPSNDLSFKEAAFRLPGAVWGVDASKEPKEFFLLSGSSKDPSAQVAAFQFDGRDLLWCPVATSEPRPIDLTKEKRDSHVIYRFRRMEAGSGESKR